jgi:hypothetical protein
MASSTFLVALSPGATGIGSDMGIPAGEEVKVTTKPESNRWTDLADLTDRGTVSLELVRLITLLVSCQARPSWEL